MISFYGASIILFLGRSVSDSVQGNAGILGSVYKLHVSGVWTLARERVSWIWAGHQGLLWMLLTLFLTFLHLEGATSPLVIAAEKRFDMNSHTSQRRLVTKMHTFALAGFIYYPLNYFSALQILLWQTGRGWKPLSVHFSCNIFQSC